MGPQKRIEVCESISGSAKVPKRKKNYACIYTYIYIYLFIYILYASSPGAEPDR